VVTNSSWSQLARAVPTAASREVGNAFGLLDVAPELRCSEPSTGVLGARAAIEGEVRPVRVGRSRMGGSHGCSLTTSRLQRLARGILCGVGTIRFGGLCTRCTSAKSASHHRDGREAGARGKGARTVRLWAITFATRRQPDRWSGSTQSKTSWVERS
jgi:hypothetical protein